MSYIPKYIIKRMFPKKEALSVVKYDGDEWICLMMVNVISPIEVPEGEIDLGGLDLPAKIGDYLTIKVNDKDVPVTEDILVNHVLLFANGKKHTWKSIFEEGSAAGEVVPVGGKLYLLVRKSVLPQEIQELATPGNEVEVYVKATFDQPQEIKVPAIVKDGGEFKPE